MERSLEYEVSPVMTKKIECWSYTFQLYSHDNPNKQHAKNNIVKVIDKLKMRYITLSLPLTNQGEC